jgi:hypothetical protein
LGSERHFACVRSFPGRRNGVAFGNLLAGSSQHQLLHVRPPQDVTFPNFEPKLYPRLLESVEESSGANLRFKTPELAATTRFARRG